MSYFRKLKEVKEVSWHIHAEDNKGDYPSHALIGVLVDHIGGRFPFDFHAIERMYIVAISNDETLQLSWTNSYAKINEDKDTHSDVGNINLVVVADVLIEVDISGSFDDAEANDEFGLTVTGLTGKTYHLLKLVLKYR